ncbi:pyridoxamine 5'-phosphate oxidase family protein [Pseudomonas sp. ZM23]|uniref:Pyridoxamine 5'-phosphate oxidase family protein n=1 Tax=Pseudomonas triclosanedens TaxID=2961893 RepID=A0ABY6ZTA7_9PSED|nr:pyridoxamine 5'-phosphate oxidase family protein [Pseudomonas triclosanedens]MCP8466665.1 pyridoxamine 5'-phosphate oxidase family protein [Pseudomonas triclosanedens]MCP8471980.1 pyridoxamine 5'-phosphate oxidase family protein [Pseudomonas triclosanedens]MCP8474636.1 pyridoxamine 5'-phosphate oxidase family protein [Pseudomonas triclosanedens]WAI47990.1 pyridoxamine 5'-phosphate oxidase family protein [Pseudomonas triclosanedens]
MDMPFHPGELEIQERAGVREQVADFGGRAIRTFMPDQHREFFALLPWLLVGSVDADGQPQASVLWGTPGFAHSPERDLLRVDALAEADDPLRANLRDGAQLGLLGLELPTRRRNRLNGVVEGMDAGGFGIRARQSFGNCPKYIQSRHWRFNPRTAGPSTSGTGADVRWLELATRSDTLFIASRYAGENGGVDISHRGGPPGFLQLADGQLWLPDYSGNNLFNTLGNLMLEPRCALLFIDFARGDLLHLEAIARIHWPRDETPIWSTGAQRMLSLQPGIWQLRRSRLPLEFSQLQYSPFLPSMN